MVRLGPLDDIPCVVLTRIQTRGYDRGRPDPLPPRQWAQLPPSERRKTPRLFPIFSSWTRALSTCFRTDAHAAMYTCAFPGWERMHPRLNTNAAGLMAELGFEVMARVAMIDVDLPEHLSWGISDEADRITRQHVEWLHEEMGAYVYATIHGARALWPLPRPMRVAEFQRFLDAFLAFLQSRIPRVDLKCRDWTRLFRLPRVRREVEGRFILTEPAFEMREHHVLTWMPPEPEPNFDARHWHMKPWDPNPINEQEARAVAALEYLPCAPFELWMRVGMCIHAWSPVRGLAIWDRWSRRMEHYNRQEVLRTWRAFKADGYAPQFEPVGLNILFELAAERGWDPCTPTQPPPTAVTASPPQPEPPAAAVAAPAPVRRPGIPDNSPRLPVASPRTVATPPPTATTAAQSLPSQQLPREKALLIWSERVQEMYDLGALSTERYLRAMRTLTAWQTGYVLEF